MISHWDFIPSTSTTNTFTVSSTSTSTLRLTEFPEERCSACHAVPRIARYTTGGVPKYQAQKVIWHKVTCCYYEGTDRPTDVEVFGFYPYATNSLPNTAYPSWTTTTRPSSI